MQLLLRAAQRTPSAAQWLRGSVAGHHALAGGPLASKDGQLLRTQLALKTPTLSLLQQATTAAAAGGQPKSHSRFFLIERVWAVGMMPLFPLALFVQNPAMDWALAIAVGLHTHWGIEIVVEDYARPFVVGEAFAKLAHLLVYVFSGLMLAGLFSFNYNDVGITKAFQMVWDL